MDKQIEELARDMDYGCVKRDLYPDDAKEIAKALYLLGYRKIPENAVVLTREEWKRMKSSLYYSKEECERRNQKICKETAEKFARLVEFHSVSTRDEEGREIFTISALGLKEILHEEFGIPYDEICKEITDKEVQNGN